MIFNKDHDHYFTLCLYRNKLVKWFVTKSDCLVIIYSRVPDR